LKRPATDIFLSQRCSWLPVDTLATTILELSNTLAVATTSPSPAPFGSSNPISNHDDNPPIFYNLVNPDSFPWSDLLHELRSAGLEFHTVPFSDWLQKLRQSAEQGDNAVRNPAVKLIDYFEKSCGTGSGTGAGAESQRFGKDENRNRIGITFETTAAQRDSQALREPPKMIEDGYVRRFLARWLKRWE
jgi:hypothetical protein